MSKLETLIQQLCPDGVEFSPLGSVCEIRSGWGFPNAEQGKKNGQFPFFKVGDMNHAGNEMYMYTANNYVSYATVKKLNVIQHLEERLFFLKLVLLLGQTKSEYLLPIHAMTITLWDLFRVAI